jgi:hypothetical protein
MGGIGLPAQDGRLLLTGRHVEPHRENIGFNAVGFLRWGIGIKAVIRIPVLRVQRSGRVANPGFICLRAFLAAVTRFQLGRITQSFDELEGEQGRSAIRILRRDAVVIGGGPVPELPPSKFAEQPIGALLRGKPIEHGAGVRQSFFHELQIVNVQPIVVNHADPQ